MSDDFGSNYAPQRMSETAAEHRQRTGQEPIAPAPSTRPTPSKVRKPGGAEWTLGLGGPLLVVLGWIIAAAAGELSDLASALAVQSFGGLLSILGITMILILIAIQAAVSTYLRHRARD